MTIKRTYQDKSVNYFCTFTCLDWLPLIRITAAYDVFYKWFVQMKTYENEITGYVIMPNHAHLLIYVSEKSPSIDKLIGNGKRFIAYEIVERLKRLERHQLLEKLAAGVSKKEQKRGKLHKVFMPSFDAKVCLSDTFIWQKLDYMHWNPLSGKWKFADSPELYPHSSARFYINGEQGLFPVKDYREI